MALSEEELKLKNLLKVTKLVTYILQYDARNHEPKHF
jgi:hypothetical protein